jgi:hypothetical protein
VLDEAAQTTIDWVPEIKKKTTSVPRSPFMFKVPASSPFRNREPEEPAEPATTDFDVFCYPPSKKYQAKRTNDMATLRSLFQTHKYLATGTPNIDLSDQSLPKENSAPNQNFTPILLAHARLYTFADMRLIHPLKNLALHKLHATLLNFQLYEQRVCDVVELARYAYDNGVDRGVKGELNELRQLVVEYMVCEVDTIGKHQAFQVLMEDGGEFVTDFWGMASKYLMKV